MELELDELPERPRRGLPAFSAEGLLPAGDHAPSRAEFIARFVAASPRRQEIFDGWNDHRDALLRAGLPESTRQLLNGSYTTAKLHPADLDLAVEVPVTQGDLRSGSPVFPLLAGPATQERFACDAYAIPCLPKEDPLYSSVTVGAIRYWTKWFGQTRDGRIKGRVWARTGGLE